MMKAVVLLLASLCVGLWAMAQQFPLISSDASPAEISLTQDLKSGFQLMPKNVVVYSHFNIPSHYPSLDSLKGRNEYLRNYYSTTFNHFWDLSYITNTFINAGPGFYVAVDPVISKEFGSDLVAIEIAAGTPMLNVVRPLPLSEQTVSSLLAGGFVSNDSLDRLLPLHGKSRAFSRDSLKNMTTDADKNFRQLVQKILQHQNIGVIEYNWNSSLTAICKNPSHSAFVLVGHSPQTDVLVEFPSTLISHFDLSDLTPAEQAAIARENAFGDLIQNVKSLRERGQKPTPATVSTYFSNLSDWNKTVSETYGCSVESAL